MEVIAPSDEVLPQLAAAMAQPLSPEPTAEPAAAVPVPDMKPSAQGLVSSIPSPSREDPCEGPEPEAAGFEPKAVGLSPLDEKRLGQQVKAESLSSLGPELLEVAGERQAGTLPVAPVRVSEGPEGLGGLERGNGFLPGGGSEVLQAPVGVSEGLEGLGEQGGVLAEVQPEGLQLSSGLPEVGLVSVGSIAG